MFFGSTININNQFSVDKNGRMMSTSGVIGGLTVSNDSLSFVRDNLNVQGSSDAKMSFSMNSSDPNGVIFEWKLSNNRNDADIITGNLSAWGMTSWSTANVYGTFYEVTADIYVTTSLWHKKDNINKITGGLNDVLNTDICEYNLIGHDDEKLYGFVIGGGYKAPERILGLNGDGINNYSAIAIAYLAIQELYTDTNKELKLIKSKLKKLENKNKRSIKNDKIKK